MEINFKHTTTNGKTTHNIFRNYECESLKKYKKIQAYGDEVIWK